MYVFFECVCVCFFLHVYLCVLVCADVKKNVSVSEGIFLVRPQKMLRRCRGVWRRPNVVMPEFITSRQTGFYDMPPFSVPLRNIFFPFYSLFWGMLLLHLRSIIIIRFFFFSFFFMWLTSIFFVFFILRHDLFDYFSFCLSWFVYFLLTLVKSFSKSRNLPIYLWMNI